MFRQNANILFNTSSSICSIMLRMNEQTERLYIAAKALRRVDGQSAVAKLLNVSPQTVNNWEDRGISNDGLLRAQEIIGCNAIWVRDGTGPMTIGNDASSEDAIIELIALFQQALPSGREMILDLARSAAKQGAASRWARVQND